MTTFNDLPNGALFRTSERGNLFQKIKGTRYTCLSEMADAFGHIDVFRTGTTYDCRERTGGGHAVIPVDE